MITGSRKLSMVGASASLYQKPSKNWGMNETSKSAGISFEADVAEPFNRVRFSVQPQELNRGLNPNLLEANKAINITPETYSGVAVVVIVVKCEENVTERGTC